MLGLTDFELLGRLLVAMVGDIVLLKLELILITVFVIVEGTKNGICEGVAVNNAVGLVEVGIQLGFRVVGNIEGDLERVEGMEVVGKSDDPKFFDVGLVVIDSDGKIVEEKLEIMVGFLVVGRILGI